ncbi:T9SS C-terminal target domain-containing protein [Prevotella communis]|uniref:T9SS C-terminal target domain-containing protein n=1 Tax=Prevotella communis TaxID=2913614 RepID=UPI001EDAB9A6|nr:T9SS C-terminal target domain-containing protein [Prevotella communis]UKK62772.1 T9SS C-terminal target domain-containing protein [Prevotella communis]UKK65598.1 T9SS C-terminal target domain-containing protein [Prevotella communis]
MKKIVTLAMLAVATMSASAQETFNLFSPADCDADGWLWLNTQEKIDRYVGKINEDAYTVDPNGKVIQLAFANINPDYTETYADPEAYGVDTQGNTILDEGVNKDECIKGAIVLAPASAMMATNGGCLVLNLPSCATIDLMLSSEARMLGRTLMLSSTNGIDNDNSTGENPWTGDTKSIYAKASVLGSLHGAGQWKWEGVESLNNGFNNDITFKSESPVYFALQNCHKYPIYVHAIRITTPKQETVGIQETITNKQERNAYYNLAGQRMTSPVKGINIIAGKKVIM